MRPVLCGLAAGVIAGHAIAAQAQQGSVQISAAAQGLTGSTQRLAAENPIEPDFGVTWLQPGVRFGTFHVELRGTRRNDRLHLGRNYAAVRDLKYRGITWSLEAGDTYFTRTIGGYGFTNLATPAVTFSGAAVNGRGTRGALQVVGGRATAWRNIFGSDPDTLGQTLGVVSGSYRLSERLEALGRASQIRTSGLREFSFTVADSRQAGGGIRYALTPAIQLIGDGSVVQYRRVDSNRQNRDGSILVGANVHLSRGWLQANASRFSPGEFPAMHDALHDRESVFAAGEYDVATRIRMFGGYEGVRTNIDPELTHEASRNLPRNLASRGFGGIRFQLGTRSTFTVRAEEGGRIARPVLGGLDRESDTGLRSAEWQAALGGFTTYLRFSRRDNVDRVNSEGTYTQDDFSAQMFTRVSRSTQVFGLATITRHEAASEAGSTYWQVGGGAQVQLWERSMWFRGEGTTSRNVDLQTRDFVPRESFNIGLNGDLSRGTTLAFNISADRTPLLFGTGTPWTTRSTVRVVQTFSTGAARVPTALTGTTAARSRGTGTVLGVVFTDWNANGIQDPDEGPLENIPVRIAAVSTVSTRRDGEFSFLNVPAGSQAVGLDTSAIPVDFDPPDESLVSVELDRGTTRRVTFGLVPLGMVRGRVVRDANGNGRADPGEEPVDGAVLVLDGGSRSEQVRRGTYRFDSIRSGDHVVSLLRESLPEGAVVTGAMAVPVALRRDSMSQDVDFLVTIEKRPETRRVFPPKGGAAPPPAPRPSADRSAPRSSAPAPSSSRAASVRDATRAPAPPLPGAVIPGTAAAGRNAGDAGTRFTVQVAALLDPARAQSLVSDLTARGYPAYVLEPGPEDPDGPYRVRVGRYPTRAAAGATATALGRASREKLWVIREPASSPVERPDNP